MSIQIIPTRSVPHYRQTTRMDGRAYVLEFDWIQRWGRWTLTIRTTDETLLAGPLTIMPGFDLIGHLHHDSRLPEGPITLIDQSEESRAPSFEWSSHLLVYLDG